MQPVPIIFTHFGHSPYLEFTLRQAKFFNPDSEIILLGDEQNNCFDFVTHVLYDDYRSQAVSFAKLYRHFSTNGFDYELFCIERWFIIREYLEQRKNIKTIFVTDSDVLIFSNLTEWASRYFTDKKAGLYIFPEINLASPGVSFFDCDTLPVFCDLCLNIYSDKNHVYELVEEYNSVLRSNNPNGISDMYLSKKLCELLDDEAVINIAAVHGGGTFDSNFNLSRNYVSDEYACSHGMKKIRFEGNKPFGFNNLLQEDVLFHVLHFQGRAKNYLPAYYRGNSFSGMRKLKCFYLLNILEKKLNILTTMIFSKLKKMF